MSGTRTLRYKGSYQGAMVLRQRLEDKGVRVEFPRKARKRLELAQRRLQKWQDLMENAELLERQDREQRELLKRLGQEPREIRGQHAPQLDELDRRHNREREEVGLPPRVARRTVGGGTGAAVSLHQLFDADLDQVGISLRCTGTAGAIAETVVQFRGRPPAARLTSRENRASPMRTARFRQRRTPPCHHKCHAPAPGARPLLAQAPGAS